MSRLALEKPKHQSPVGVAVIFFHNLRIAVNIFISVIVVQFGLKSSLFGFNLYLIAAILVILFLVVSYLQYQRFFFYVRNENFIIEKGLIKQEKINIAFDRIQTVNLRQNLIQQLLGVVALTIDTAGSSQKEIEIPALSKSYARELQKYLIRQKGDELHNESAEHADEMPHWYEDDSEAYGEGKALIKLGIADLLKVGITENHLRTGILLFVVLYGYVLQYEEYLLKPFEPYLKEKADLLLTQYIILIPLLILLFLLVSVLISMVQTVLKYFDLRFYVSEKGAQLVSGLLKRVEYQIPINKIQYLKWKSNPLRKLLSLKTLIIKQASSKEAADRKSISVPGCNEFQLDAVLDEFYPERLNTSYYERKAERLLFLQLGTWLAIVPGLILVFLALIYWSLLIVAVLYSAIGLLFIYRYYRSIKLSVQQEMFILQKGWVFPSTLYLKFYKLQNVKLRQSVFQKSRGLASLTFYTAAGDETMPHIPLQEAREIYNYSLYKIESSVQSWM